ncbi:hypothetical protein HDV57DRAFT_515293 [Trichoderma longibrachiatum]
MRSPLSHSLPIGLQISLLGNNSHPNLFSRDILNLLYSKTGKYPYIRVGGTSADRTYYNGSQKESILVESGANGIPSAVYVGPAYFEAFNSFPGSLWTFQANLANNATWGLNNTLEYVQEWTTYAGAISEHVLQGNRYGLEEQRFFQGLVFANAELKTFTTPNAFNGGIDLSNHVKSVSLHQ